ncbi:MAG: protein kinase [Myxococcales bacterium]|nr:protein kinase [Myxococcales bacterium]
MRLCPQCETQCDTEHKFCPVCGFPISKLGQQADDPLLGRTLPGGYVILELVGIGGMGRVYRAEQTNLGRTVAVKIIHPHLVGEENAAARFITEARAASRLNHPNSVSVIDFGKTEDGQLYLVMEFLRGKDLARLQYDDGPLSFRRISNILQQILAALSEAHHLGIIHRDLKPENVIIEPMRSGGDFVKVVDFGLAKMREGAAQPNITSPGIVCGTPEYMSPEQGRGDPLDARSDLYAVGVIFYQLLTGRLPFEAQSPTQVVLMHITEQPEDPRSAAPDRGIAAQLSDVCLMALAKDAQHRFSTADEFREALTDALSQIETSQPAIRQASPLPAVASVRCAACGSENAGGQKFCGECGVPLQAPASSAAPAAATEAAPAAPVEREHPADGGDRTLPGVGGASSRAGAPKARREPASTPAEITFPLPFSGREEDLAWLFDRRDDAKSSLVGARIVGEIGVGKTRLLNEFLDAARSEGDVVVSVAPDPAWAEEGFHALKETICTLTGIPKHGATPSAWSSAGVEARRGLAEIFAYRSGRDDTAMPPDELRFAVAEALRWAIVRASELAPGKRVIIAVDDLHAVDGASRTALADAVGEPPLVPCVLIVTYPPGHDPGWPASTASARVLMGLAPGVVATLLAGAPKPSSPIGGRGVAPLYVEQLARFAREEGGRPPSRLADLIALRVERLPPTARRVLQAISVYGGEADEGILSRLLPELSGAGAAIDELVDAGMVERVDKGLTAAHPLIRDVVLATIPAAVRRGLHAACAEIGEGNGMSVEARALHEHAAQNSFQALLLLEQAATGASHRGDLAGSITWVRRGLELARRELFRRELDDPERAVIIFARKLGEALTQAGQFTDAEGVLAEALDLAPGGSDRARILAARAQVSAMRDRTDEAGRFLNEAMAIAFTSGSHELLTSLETMKQRLAAR